MTRGEMIDRIGHGLFPLCFGHVLIIPYKLAEGDTQIINSLKCGFARYLKKFEHRENVVRTVVERGRREQHYLVAHT